MTTRHNYSMIPDLASLQTTRGWCTSHVLVSQINFPNVYVVDQSALNSLSALKIATVQRELMSGLQLNDSRRS